jgi:hypothetical protein
MNYVDLVLPGSLYICALHVLIILSILFLLIPSLKFAPDPKFQILVLLLLLKTLLA